jgi:hypothetical protein
MRSEVSWRKLPVNRFKLTTYRFCCSSRESEESLVNTLFLLDRAEHVTYSQVFQIVVDKIQLKFLHCRVSSLVKSLAFGGYSFGFSLDALKCIAAHFTAHPGTLSYIDQVLIRSAELLRRLRLFHR